MTRPLEGGYKRPRRLNAVSIVVVAALAAGVYSAVVFGPVYWRKWSVKGVLDEAAHRYYRARRATGEAEQAVVTELTARVTSELRALGVADARLKIFFRKVPGTIDVWAEYQERIPHPFVKKVTVLRFRPAISMSY